MKKRRFSIQKDKIIIYKQHQFLSGSRSWYKKIFWKITVELSNLSFSSTARRFKNVLSTSFIPLCKKICNLLLVTISDSFSMTSCSIFHECAYGCSLINFENCLMHSLQNLFMMSFWNFQFNPTRRIRDRVCLFCSSWCTFVTNPNLHAAQIQLKLN